MSEEEFLEEFTQQDASEEEKIRAEERTPFFVRQEQEYLKWMEETTEYMLNVPFNPGDEYSPDDYWAELLYCEFDAMMSRRDAYNFYHCGHEDGPSAYAAECLAEECLSEEIEVESVIDDYDEMSAEDMERDAQLELQAMCDAAAVEETYFKCTY
jgi:hypothetical protein